MSALRQAAARAKGAALKWRDRTFGPLVTVVVPVYQAEPYLDECLTTLRAQTHDRMQVVVVDDGSTDGSRGVYERHAAADGRIEVVRQDNRGLGAARNVGIARARGDYLTFLDADDTLPPNAYERMVAVLEETGSDFATGGVLRVSSGRRSTPAWIREVHAQARRGVRIDDFPRAVMDVIACNRMFRTSSWRSLGLSFPEGVAYEDHVPMMTAYVRGRFDVLRETTYLWRIREDHTSIGQQKHTVDNLRDRLEAKRGARAVLEAEASPTVLAAWQSRVLDMDLRLFIDEVPHVGDDYWAVLRDGVREHVDRATPQVWEDVRVEQRLRAWLVAHDHRREVESLIARSAAGERVVHGRVEGSEVVVRADVPDAVLPPPELLRVGERELGLVVSLRSLRVDGDHLVLVLAPHVGPVVDGVQDATLTAVLVGPGGAERRVVAAPADAATWERHGVPLAGSPWPDLRVLRLGLDDVPEGGPWAVETEYAVGGRTWRGPITSRDPDGDAGRPDPVLATDRALVPRWRARSGLSVEVVRPSEEAPLPTASGAPDERPLLVVDDAQVTPHGVRLEGSWRGSPASGSVELVGDLGATLALAVHEAGEDRVALEATWDELPPAGVWRLAAGGPGARAWVAPALLARLPLVVPAEGTRLGVIRDTDEAPALRIVARKG